jgi:hypothetical protein
MVAALPRRHRNVPRLQWTPIPTAALQRSAIQVSGNCLTTGNDPQVTGYPGMTDRVVGKADRMRRNAHFCP